MSTLLKKGNSRGLVAEGYKELFSIDPDSLFLLPRAEIIKDQKRIKVCRVNWKGEYIFIKRYNPYSIWSRLESTLKGSKAFHSWVGAESLINSGFKTAQPIAAIEFRKSGLMDRSFYITREIGDARISVYYFREEFLDKKASVIKRRSFLRAMAGIFSRLHEKGIYHNDLKDYNILIRDKDSGWEFYLLDLEGVRRFNDIPKKKRIKNLVQIYRTLGEQLTWPDKVAFFKEYGEETNWKAILRSVLAEASEEDSRKKKRDGFKKAPSCN